MNSIQSLIISKISGKRKHTPSDWLSFNAVCCVHNGETVDKKKRGGFILSDNGGISYHCFNCSFRTSWMPGRPLSFKFKKLLKWLSMSDDEINWMRMEVLKTKTIEDNAVKPIDDIEFTPRGLPESAKTIKEWNMFFQLKSSWPNDFLETIVYAFDRKIDLSDTILYWTPETKDNMNKRIIIPIFYQNTLYGYTARAIDKIKPKYLTNHPPHMVFNYDAQTPNRQFVIVTEGIFDALTLGTVAIMTNDVSEIQAKLINKLNRQVIVVPHFDKPGRKLIEAAITYNWSISVPPWQDKFKDINEAVCEYGKVFVMKTILDNVIDNSIRIQLYLKGLK